jgi:redox-sensitive bicupin YhaK (pirin superfamily)
MTLEATTNSNREVIKVVQGIATQDGAGVSLTRVIGAAALDMLDPFLLLDSFESDNPDDYIAGFPPHPHRGFETVTYMLTGQLRHEDNQGHEGVIGPGGVQWMTAGRGIVHSEMPEQKDGLLHGFQLWVNLPRTEKMTEPRYQEFSADEIPAELRADGIEVRVIAGTTSQGTTGPVTDVVTEPLYLHVDLPAGQSLSERIAATHSAFVYTIAGQVAIAKNDDAAGCIVPARSLGVLGAGDLVSLSSIQGDAQFLLVAGCRLNEPVARGGPFVMNTREEVEQAARDFHNGLF